jgi:peptide/nickel transport system ATP-binding protein
MSKNILEIRNLEVYYSNVKVIRGVNLDVRKGEIFAIVGESGSGKSTIANAIMRNLPEIGRIGKNSSITFIDNNEKYDLVKMDENDFNKKIRWTKISMVFQAAMNAFNPTISIKDHFIETAKAHGIKDTKSIIERSKELLKMVNLDPIRVLKSYPHELSGGMKQRVLIALSLLLNPKLIILDEPTTALDVLTQRIIIDILKDLKSKLSLTYILITHDLALVADIADRVGVLYAGRFVEIGNINEIFYTPYHPYTIGLLNSVPKIGEFKEVLTIPGKPPDFRYLPSGCKFNPRCPIRIISVCDKEEPELVNVNTEHFVACYNYNLASKKGRDIYV